MALWESSSKKVILKKTRQDFPYDMINIIKMLSIFSLAIHPNKLLIASGQTTGHDRREGRVSQSFCIL